MTEHQTSRICAGIEQLASALDGVADAIHALGNNRAGTNLGGTEALVKILSEATREGLHEIAWAIRNYGRGGDEWDGEEGDDAGNGEEREDGT